MHSMCLCGPMVTSDCEVMGHLSLWSNGYHNTSDCKVMCLCGHMVITLLSDCKVMGHVPLWSNGYQWLQGHGACASVVQWLPATARSWGMCLCGPMVTSDCKVMCLCGPMVITLLSDCKVMGHVSLWSNGYQWLQGHGACASVVQWLPVTARSWGMCLCGPMVTSDCKVMCLCGPMVITLLSDCKVMGHVSLWSNGYQSLQGHGACASVVQWLPVTARSWGMCLCGPMVTSDCKVMGHVSLWSNGYQWLQGHVPLWSNGYQWLQGHGACASVVQWLSLCLVIAGSWGMCLCGPMVITLLSDCKVMGYVPLWSNGYHNA